MNDERCWICRDDSAAEHRGVPVCARSSCNMILGFVIGGHDLLVDLSGLRGVPNYRTEPMVERARAALPKTFSPEPEDEE